MGFLSDLIIKIGADITDLDKGVNQAQRRIQTFASAAQSAGAAMSLTMTAPMVAFGAAALTAAGQLEQTKVAYTNLLKSGESAKGLLNDLREFALSTPFQFSDLTDAGKKLLAVGFAAKDIIPTMTSLGNAVSALGGGKDLMDRLISVMGKLKAGANVTSREMLQFTEAAIPAWQLLADKIGVSVPEAMQMVHKGQVTAATALDAVMVGINERFGGGMEEQSKTLLGMWSNVVDGIEKLLANMGEGLIPMGKNMVTSYINPMIEGAEKLAFAFSQLSPEFQTTAVVVGVFAAAIPVAIFALGLMAEKAIALRMVLVGVGPIVVAQIASFRALGAAAMVAVAGLAALGVALVDHLIGNYEKMISAQMLAKKTTADLGVQTARNLDILVEKAGRAGAGFEDFSGRVGLLNKLFKSGQIGVEEYAAETSKLTRELQGVPLKKVIKEAESLQEAVGKVRVDKKKMGFDVFDEVAQAFNNLFKKDLAENVKEIAKFMKFTAETGPVLLPETAMKAITAFYEKGKDFSVNSARYGAYLVDKMKELPPNIDTVTKSMHAMFADMKENGGDGVKEIIRGFDDLIKHGHTMAEVYRFLGIAIDDNSKTAMNFFGEYLRSAYITTDGVMEAWSKVGHTVDKLANKGISQAVELQNEMIDALKRTGAPLGEILKMQERILQSRIESKALTGKAATAEIIALTNLKIKMEILRDASQAWGRVYEGVMKSAMHSLDSVGRGLADIIVEQKRWGDVATQIVKQLAKDIIVTLVDGALAKLKKAMFDAFNPKKSSSSNGPVPGVPNIPGAEDLGKIPGLGGLSSGGGFSSGGGGGGGGGAGGIIDNITGIVTAVSSVISNFQFAHMNTALGRIEESTRYLKIYTGEQPQSILWSTQTTAERLKYLQGTTEDSGNRLLEIRDILTRIERGGGLRTTASTSTGTTAAMVADLKRRGVLSTVTA